MEEEKEEWRPVVGYEGLYEVSSFGSLKSLSRNVPYINTTKYIKGVTIKQSPNGYGYFSCSLCVNGIATCRQVHQLVAESFLGHVPSRDLLVVDHVNGNRTDNRAINLRIVTTRENTSTCFRKNRNKYTSKYVGVNWHKGHGKWQSRITYSKKSYNLGFYDIEEDASNIYELALSHILDNSFYAYWDSIKKVRRGYYFSKKNKKWNAAIVTGGKSKFLGSFLLEKDAESAYNEALKIKISKNLLANNNK